jgi:hypothetical protein
MQTRAGAAAAWSSPDGTTHRLLWLKFVWHALAMASRPTVGSPCPLPSSGPGTLTPFQTALLMWPFADTGPRGERQSRTSVEPSLGNAEGEWSEIFHQTPIGSRSRGAHLMFVCGWLAPGLASRSAPVSGAPLPVHLVEPDPTRCSANEARWRGGDVKTLVVVATDRHRLVQLDERADRACLAVADPRRHAKFLGWPRSSSRTQRNKKKLRELRPAPLTARPARIREERQRRLASPRLGVSLRPFSLSPHK